MSNETEKGPIYANAIDVHDTVICTAPNNAADSTADQREVTNLGTNLLCN